MINLILFSGSIEPAEYAVLNSYFDWMTSKLHDMLRVDLIGKLILFILSNF